MIERLADRGDDLEDEPERKRLTPALAELGQRRPLDVLHPAAWTAIR